jgi:serine/threonine protein kinase/tetratricopeptide (TPR) repeat protein
VSDRPAEGEPRDEHPTEAGPAGDDPQPATEVHGRAGSKPPSGAEDRRPEEGERPRDHPDRIGPYRIVRVLGEGGMGRVFLAEQSQPVERRVAIKLVHTSLTGRTAMVRFAAERQAMARLSHPAIAQMFEAGTTDDGFPFFVMELVEGEPITAYCDRQGLSIEERLALFAEVCAGVQHAHQKGIIHRDLKPSNILVTEAGDRRLPKVIDFGIAKALDQPLTEATRLTAGGWIGTPEYMSPEALEVADEGSDLDTRSDVYALGILLYRLLAGVTPLDLQGSTLSRRIFELTRGDPPWPSARFAGLHTDERQGIAAARGIDPATLDRRLRGDLDWIVTKAIARQRDDRYASAAELAADVERHLSDEPVLASPPSRLYQLRKFVRRHRTGVVAAGLVALALVGGIAGASIGLIRARRAEEVALAQARRADREAEATRQVADFLVDLFAVSDPGAPEAASVTARELLDAGAARIQAELPDQPLLRARMMSVIGDIYGNLGLFGDAERLLAGALEIRRTRLGGEDPETAAALDALAELEFRRADLAAAERLFREALAIRERTLGPRHPDVAASLRGLGNTLNRQARYDEAVAALARCLVIQEETLGADHLEVGRTLVHRAAVHWRQGRHDEAVATGRRALAILEAELGADHYEAVTAQGSLASSLEGLGRLDEAAALYRQSLEGLERIVEPDHPELARILSNFSRLEVTRGRYVEARRLAERVLPITEAAFGPRHARVAGVLDTLGFVAWRRGDLEEAAELLEQSLSIREEAQAEGHPDLALTLWALAGVYRDGGRLDDAEPLYRRALAIQRRALEPGHEELEATIRDYAALLRATGRPAEAAGLLEASPPTP